MRAPARSPLAYASAVAVPSSLLSQLGFYAVLPLLPVLLDEYWHVTSPWVVGLALFTLSASMRGASVLLSNSMQSVPLKASVGGGLVAAAAAFAALSVVAGPSVVVLCLAFAGVGISTSALALRVFVTESLESSERRNTVFSAVQVVANVGAAVGPLAGALLLERSPTTLLLTVSGAYGVAAAAALLLVPATAPRRYPGRPPLSRRTFVDIVHDDQMRYAAATAATGTFLYAQLFSAVAVHLATVTPSSALRSSVFATNAVLVIVLQGPVSAFMNRRLRAATPAFAFLRGGVMLFAASLLVLAALGDMFGGLLAAIVVFSLAETFFTPMLNTAFGEISGERSTLELFNVRQIASSVGESAGTFVGGAVFSFAQMYGRSDLYWVVLATGAVCVVAGMRRWPPPAADPAASSSVTTPVTDREMDPGDA